MRLSAAAPLLASLLTFAIFAAGAPAPGGNDAALQSAKNVGLAALEEGDLPEAAKRFETVRRLAPAEPLGWANGAVTALRAKSAGDAKTLAAEALKRAPGDARVLAIEGARAEAAGDTAAAIAAYEKAATVHPKDLGSSWSAARLLLAAPASAATSGADRERARRLIERALAEAPGNSFLLFRLLELERASGDPARVSAAFDRAARSIESRDARTERAVSEAKAALMETAGTDFRAAEVKVRILENLLRGTPRYQQARHDVEPGVLGIPLEDWSPELAARLRARPRGVAVRFAPKPSGLETLRGVTSVRAFGKTGRDLAVAAESGLVLASASKSFAPGSPIASSGGVRRLAVADVANLGSLDLVAPGALFLAEAGGGFRRTAIAPGEGVVPLDFDSDGDLDLYVSASGGDRLLRNNLDGTWFDASAGLPQGTSSRAAVAADFDRDGDPDLVIARPGGGLALLDNLRGGRFSVRDAGLPKSGAVTALAAGDVNGDGRPDLVWTTEAAAFVALNRGDGVFLPARELPSGGAPLLFDFDNDGSLDLLLASLHGSVLYRNDGAGGFHRVEAESAALPAAVDAEALDVDGDGDLDLVLACADGKARVFENQGGNANGWIDVALEALPTGSAKVNRFGYGSEIEVKAGELYAFRTASAPVTHVGLGSARKPDVLRVVWTNGVPQNALAPPARTLVREVQQLKGSCPFLYAFDGRSRTWSFVTDVLGRSPAGLLYDGVHQATADTREWLVLPGEALVAGEGGRLVLDLTEELWEAAYIDLAELSAVDHPAGIGVVADEKMVPPPFPPKRLYTVARPLTPRATDEKGRDRTAEIAAQDGRHLAGFAPTRWQGIVAPHDLILELPEARVAKRVMLYLTGWVFYADTSIQVALSQAAVSRERPFGPVLEVPDGRGGWKTAIPAIGYPAGKTKTMPVDLSSVLDRSDPRVRIRTNLAVYWDRIAYTADEDVAPLRVTRVPLVSGELSYRGFSRMTKDSEDGPLVFVHDDVDRAPRWADPAGRYTRFGDVRPLLDSADDRYVVMKGGDSIRLAFDGRSLPPLPAGWVRDWLLVLDGWDKDADKNTVAGQTVEPLPFHGMDDARYGERQEPADAEGMRRFRSEWLTRPGGPGEFVDALRAAGR